MSRFNVSQSLPCLLGFGDYLEMKNTTCIGKFSFVVNMRNKLATLLEIKMQENLFILTPDVNIATFFFSSISSTSSLVLDFPARKISKMMTYSPHWFLLHTDVAVQTPVWMWTVALMMAFIGYHRNNRTNTGNFCRFQVTFQHVGPKFVANLQIMFSSSEIRHELHNEVRKFISMFELLL